MPRVTPEERGERRAAQRTGNKRIPPQGRALARPQPRSLPPPLRHKPGPAAGGPSRRLRLTCGVQEEPQRQAPAQGRVCRPHPQPGDPHGARRPAKGEQRRPGHGQRPEAEPGLSGSARRSSRPRGRSLRRPRPCEGLRGAARLPPRWSPRLFPPFAFVGGRPLQPLGLPPSLHAAGPAAFCPEKGVFFISPLNPGFCMGTSAIRLYFLSHWGLSGQRYGWKLHLEPRETLLNVYSNKKGPTGVHRWKVRVWGAGWARCSTAALTQVTPIYFYLLLSAPWGEMQRLCVAERI